MLKKCCLTRVGRHPTARLRQAAARAGRAQEAHDRGARHAARLLQLHGLAGDRDHDAGAEQRRPGRQGGRAHRVQSAPARQRPDEPGGRLRVAGAGAAARAVR